MLKCYCDRCSKETTVKFVNLQIRMKGASNTSTKHLCPTCWGRVMDVLDNVQHEVEPDVKTETKPKVKTKNTELEEKFLSTCYGVDAGKICSLHDANWVPQDIADETGKSLDIVFTIIDMYELYSEIPNTKECIPKVAGAEERAEVLKKMEEAKESGDKIKKVRIVVPTISRHEKVQLEPYLIDEYIETLGPKALKDIIKNILLDMCTGLYCIQDIINRYKLDHQYAHKHYKQYVAYCMEHAEKGE